MQLTKLSLPLRCAGKEDKLYNVPPTNTEFHNESSKHFHTTRYALTNNDQVLDVHVDSQNPRGHKDLEDSYMNMPVICFSVKLNDDRCCLIG
eukprot:3264757-Ditylum_brightwellii.AAC.1